MRKIIALIGLAGMLTLGLIVSTSYASPPSDPGAAHDKVTLCHRTESEKNPFVEITVNFNSVEDAQHVGGHVTHTGDIIPAFTYTDSHGSYSFGGQGDQAVLRNGCELVVTTTTTPTTPTTTTTTTTTVPTTTTVTVPTTTTVTVPITTVPPTTTVNTPPPPVVTPPVSAPPVTAPPVTTPPVVSTPPPTTTTPTPVPPTTTPVTPPPAKAPKPHKPVVHHPVNKPHLPKPPATVTTTPNGFPFTP